MYVTMSLSLYNVYNSLLYFILHSPLSFVGPKMTLKTFLSETPKIVSSDFDNTLDDDDYDDNDDDDYDDDDDDNSNTLFGGFDE